MEFLDYAEIFTTYFNILHYCKYVLKFNQRYTHEKHFYLIVCKIKSIEFKINHAIKQLKILQFLNIHKIIYNLTLNKLKFIINKKFRWLLK